MDMDGTLKTTKVEILYNPYQGLKPVILDGYRLNLVSKSSIIPIRD